MSYSKIAEFMNSNVQSLMDRTSTVRRVKYTDYVMDSDEWCRNRGRELAKEWFPCQNQKDELHVVAADAVSAVMDYELRFNDHARNAIRLAWWKDLCSSPKFLKTKHAVMHNVAMAMYVAKRIAKLWFDRNSLCGSGHGGSDGMVSGRDAMCIIDNEVTHLKVMTKGFLDDGMRNHTLDTKAIVEQCENIMASPLARAAFLWAGRGMVQYRSIVANANSPTVHRGGGMEAVERGKSFIDLIRSDQMLAAGAIPELADYYRYRMASGSLQRWLYKEVRESGPIVMYIDESGSMMGDHIIAAKGLALMMSYIARRQQRWLALVSFNDGSDNKIVVLPPGKNNISALVEWCSNQMGGGTSLHTLVAETPELWKDLVSKGLQPGKTDVVVVTDDAIPITNERKIYRSWAKENNVTTYGVVLGVEGMGTMASICDHFWQVRRLDGMAVEDILSISRI